METLENQLHSIQDEIVFRLISQMAKPTVTLTQLKTSALKQMEELELRGALGRLWRSVKVYRHALTGGVVLYWTEETVRAVAASGVRPDMPEGVPLPDCVQYRPKEDIAQEYQKQELQQEVKEEKLTRQEENKRKSRGQLIPISQTAALPMRPLAEGEPGAMQRGTIRANVACVLFRYRDVRLSIDAVASLLPQHTRTDVAAVISQITNGYNKRYFIRHNGATRFDHTYQWNHEFNYPFSSRLESDGEAVTVRNADPEAKDDETLDHLPPDQLTENETESEIARLLREAQEQSSGEAGPAGEHGPIGPSGCPRGVDGPQEEKERPIRIDYGAPIHIAAKETDTENSFVRGENGQIIGTRGSVGDPGCGHADSDVKEVVNSLERVGVTVNSVDNVTSNENSAKVVEVNFTPAKPVESITLNAGCKLSAPEIEILDAQERQVQGTATIESNAKIRRIEEPAMEVTTHEGVRRVKNSNAKFRVALFDDNELVLHFGESTIELTPEQTDKVMSLLGPRYLAGLKAA